MQVVSNLKYLEILYTSLNIFRSFKLHQSLSPLGIKLNPACASVYPQAFTISIDRYDIPLNPIKPRKKDQTIVKSHETTIEIPFNRHKIPLNR